MLDNTRVFEQGVALFNAKNIHALMELFQPDCRMTMPGGDVLGREDIAGMYRMLFDAYPDGRFEVLRSIGSGNTVVEELRFDGTQTGPLVLPTGQVPATGKHITYRTCDVVDFRDGRIAEWHAYFDVAGILGQLGLD